MKKLLRLFICIVVVATLYSCKKNDDTTIIKPEVIDKPDPKPDPVNQAPNSFLLLTPEIDRTIVNRTPTFSWEQATDPDGDIVTYDLYLDTSENPSTLIAENLSTTSFELLENLDFKTDYHWKVVAKDAKGGFTEAMPQELLVDIPIKWLARNENPNGPIVFKYSSDRLIKIGPLFIDLEGSPSRLVELRKMNESFEYEYAYTATGKQNEVFVDETAGDYRWLFEYDESDRINSITQEYIFYNGEGASTILTKSVFEYESAANLHPNAIKVTKQDDIVRHTLSWEDDNIVEVLTERHNLQSGFEFEALLKIEYDDYINPYYSIFTHQFGFDSFFVLTRTPTEFESIDFEFFSWQSFNNIVSYEIFNSPAGTDVIGGYSKNYSYNDSYYPTSAMVEQTGMSSESFQQTWSYDDQ